MPNRALAAVLCAVILIAVSPLIVRGVQNFKTFLELSRAFGPCDGAGSPRC